MEILEAALAVFGERSVSAATLDEIALAAGVRRSTIYIYFRNKEEIFSELTRSFLPVMPDAYDLKTSLKPLEIDEQLREVVRIVNCALMEPRTAGLLRLVIAEGRNFPRIARAYRDAISERLLRPLIMVIERGVAEGAFRPIDPYLAARLAVTVPSFAAIWDTPWNSSTAPNAANRWDIPTFLAAHTDFFVAAMMAP